MKGFNSVTIAGNLTRDPERKTTTSGTDVASFTLAVNEKWAEKEKTHFVDCVVYGKSAGVIAQYTTKGSPLLVHGKINQNTWEQDGQKRSKIEIIVRDFNFIGGGDKTDE